MEESEKKSTRSPISRVREGSGNRAKNHTVILDPGAAGGVRARLGGEFQVASDSERVGGLEKTAAHGDQDWESPRVSSDLGVRKAPVSFVTEPADSAEERSDDDAFQAAPLGLEDGPVFADSPNENVEAGRLPGGIVEQPEDGRMSAASWDPLGLFAEAAEELVSATPQQEPTLFTPDPLPEFVQAVEEPMLTEAEPRGEEVYWKSCTQLVGFLVSFDYDPAGSYLELRTGRLIVSSQLDPASNCLVLSHESVSPSHAVMRVAAGGSIQVLDQLSESGTRIRKFETGEELLLSGEKAVLSHGDVVSFGDRNFHVCLVMGNPS